VSAPSFYQVYIILTHFARYLLSLLHHITTANASIISHRSSLGPYAYVRHPSYTGALLAGSGTILSLVVGRGSWARECLWPFLYYRVLIPLFPLLRRSDETDLRFHGRAPGNSADPSFSLDPQSFDVGPTLVVFALTLFLAWAIFVPRMKREDAMMEREFGDEWRNWKNRVRCKLIPGVY